MEKEGRDGVVDFARHRGGNEYDSNFETDSESVVAADDRSSRRDLVAPSPPRREPKAHRDVVSKEYSLEEKRRERNCFLALDAYTRHKKLINDYLLCYPGSTSKLKRDTSRDRTDFDVIRENHQFLWDDEDDDAEPPTWEKQLAKRYYDKLFKEYCICDLTYYQANKIAMRWRTEQEVIAGKGQFSCGDRHCKEASGLRTWEVNFAYFENNEKKNALVKLRLCKECSFKLNYRFQRKELTKNVTTKRLSSKHGGGSEKKRAKMDEVAGERVEPAADQKEDAKDAEESVWSKPSTAEEEKSQEEEFDSYLADMFL